VVVASLSLPRGSARWGGPAWSKHQHLPPCGAGFQCLQRCVAGARSGNWGHFANRTLSVSVVVAVDAGIELVLQIGAVRAWGHLGGISNSSSSFGHICIVVLPCLVSTRCYTYCSKPCTCSSCLMAARIDSVLRIDTCNGSKLSLYFLWTGLYLVLTCAGGVAAHAYSPRGTCSLCSKASPPVHIRVHTRVQSVLYV
jgi:hypothetical protein